MHLHCAIFTKSRQKYGRNIVEYNHTMLIQRAIISQSCQRNRMPNYNFLIFCRTESNARFRKTLLPLSARCKMARHSRR